MLGRKIGKQSLVSWLTHLSTSMVPPKHTITIFPTSKPKKQVALLTSTFIRSEHYKKYEIQILKKISNYFSRVTFHPIKRRQRNVNIINTQIKMNSVLFLLYQNLHTFVFCFLSSNSYIRTRGGLKKVVTL